MTNLVTKTFPFLFLIITFSQNINEVNALRCAHSCSITPIALGSPDPIKTPCNTVDINTTTTVCSVFLDINFETSYVRGTLGEKARSGNQSSTLHLSFTLFPSKTLTFITYQCATTDDCDQEFVRETVSSSKWSQLNETKARTDIASLLIQTDSSGDNLICADNLICPWNQSCHAELTQNNSNSQINFNNKFPCGSTSSSEVTFIQNFNTPGDNQDVTMQIYCNKDACNQQNTVEQVYNIFRNDFNLPLNYSAYTPGPKPNGSYRVNGFISIPVFCLYIFHFFSLLKSVLWMN